MGYKDQYPLTSITADSAFQIRAKMDSKWIKELSELYKAGATIDPVTVYVTNRRDPDFLLVDGFHRFEAAKKAGQKSISVKVIEGSRADAMKAALGANVRHGIQRTNADKRRAAEVAIKEFPDLSTAELARICGVSWTCIDNTKQEFQSSSIEGSESEKAIGRDGKSRPRRLKVKKPISSSKRDDVKHDNQVSSSSKASSGRATGRGSAKKPAADKNEVDECPVPPRLELRPSPPASERTVISFKEAAVLSIPLLEKSLPHLTKDEEAQARLVISTFKNGYAA
ncbi:ParB/RepB/Spo0J family partition protein [Rubellicoccus peritrichatus]|uniref:ParB/RepB/Spo0J family partition protein n=1 Tax=Rubellicoccus peritrichatus TaxID=3080537 RepID=A0AAQ3QSZ5_9BACT|nr:ParB/RepB/Spo0J family partition protein [Puniceicoccus sp. CR14]WOO43133.1 ParB/RepB/Spo0J family partition protein [Puniceicoccus sp. CR14]